MKPKQTNRRKYLNPGTVILVKQIFFGMVVFACVAIVIASIWYGTRIKALTIDTVTVSGGVTIDKEAIRVLVNEKLSGDYIKLIPKRFAFFYPEKDIFNTVSQVERIKDVSVKRSSFNEVQVSYNEYISDNLWCGMNSDSVCYFLDNTGYSFGKAPELFGHSLVRYYTPEVESELGVRPFLQEDYKTTKEFTKRLAEMGWFVVRVEINSVRDVFYTLARGSEIKTTLTETVEEPLSNLGTILQSKEFNHLEPGSFKYIDLRFGARVFVNEEMDVIPSTTTDAFDEGNLDDIEG